MNLKNTSSEYALDRKRLVRGSNTMNFYTNPLLAVESPLAPNNNTLNRPLLTPFRSLFNAGDPNGSINKPLYVNNNSNINIRYRQPINQVSGSRRSSNLGGNLPTRNNSSNANASFWSGNPKYVYDGSDYVKFKKLQVANRSY